ncbi:MAG: NAD-dependent epimerase/dehydratase family protein [Thermoflexales bacterium]|nr:NAD-dependent epimerase/dehydratase family protein [Thermoflexales bacterium]
MEKTVRGKIILVVGGAGFVGSNLVRRCLREGCERVLVVDNLMSSERDNLPDDARLELRVGSIADDGILAGLADEFDTVFHLATYHGNQSSIANPLADHDNNLITTLKLYERLKGFQRLKRVVYSSTGCALAAKVAGPAEPVVEDGPIPLDFDSPYQVSKVVGEMYSVYHHRLHGLPVVRARFQNVYGPGEVLGAGQWRGTPATIWRNVTPTFIYRAFKRQPLQLHGNGDSSRDFIYVDDIVEGLLCCACADGVEGDVFNLASGVEVSILELAQTINDLAGNPAGIEFIPTRTWDRSINRVGSTRKSRHYLDFEAKVALRDGLTSTIAWTGDNLARIEGCIHKHHAFCQVEF